jgi:hypothetical protein
MIMKRMSFIISGLLITILALASISCGSEQLSSILTSAVSGKSAAGMVAGSGNGNVTVSMNTRGLSKTKVTVGDGEFDYYTYPNAYVGKVIVTLSKLPESVEELRTINLPGRMKDIHESPYVLLPLYVAALYQYSKNKAVGKAMIEYIGRQKNLGTGKPESLVISSQYSQIDQYCNSRVNPDYMESLLTYFDSARAPYTMTIELTNTSYTASKDALVLRIKSSKQSSPKENTIWCYDSNGDGKYDYFYPTNIQQLAHGFGAY